MRLTRLPKGARRGQFFWLNVWNRGLEEVLSCQAAWGRRIFGKTGKNKAAFSYYFRQQHGIQTGIETGDAGGIRPQIQ